MAAMVDHFCTSNIRRLPLFAHLSQAQLEAVAEAFQQARFAPGERLYRQGETSPALYVFVSGGGRSLRLGPDGVEREQGEVQTGSTLGEEYLFTNQPHDTSLMITRDSIVLVLTRPRLEAVLAARPDIRQVLSIPRNLFDSMQ